VVEGIGSEGEPRPVEANGAVVGVEGFGETFLQKATGSNITTGDNVRSSGQVVGKPF